MSNLAYEALVRKETTKILSTILCSLCILPKEVYGGDHRHGRTVNADNKKFYCRCVELNTEGRLLLPRFPISLTTAVSNVHSQKCAISSPAGPGGNSLPLSAGRK